MPISFSVCCNISFVIRWGVGDGDGDGVGEGVGAVVDWAKAPSGRLVTASPVTPTAGSSFNKARRSNPLTVRTEPVLDRFVVFDLDCFRSIASPESAIVNYGTMVPEPAPVALSFPYLSLTTLAFPN